MQSGFGQQRLDEQLSTERADLHPRTTHAHPSTWPDTEWSLKAEPTVLFLGGAIHSVFGHAQSSWLSFSVKYVQFMSLPSGLFIARCQCRYINNNGDLRGLK